ncbi:hypothetical protein T484DRAFT_1803376 [Baffinella frigidus]|nr:hypothetical protein T484DRAFT_1803376 [Cryptophyta sp. CCMP2293]
MWKLLVGAAAGGMVWLWLRSRRQAAAEWEDMRGKAQLKLLPDEHGTIMSLAPATNTITFFNGDGASAHVWMRRRLAEVLLENPWLDGRLDTAEGGETVLLCREGKLAEGDALPTMLFPMHRPEERGASVSRAMPYERLAAALAAAGLLAKNGKDSVGRNEPIFKVALLLDAERPKERFALVVSMNHVIGDGHTFYAVHNMLSKNVPVVPLNTTRNFAAPMAIESAMGHCEDVGESTRQLGFILRFATSILLSKLLGANRKQGMCFLDDAWVAREKRAAAAGGLVEFVSTNDVVTSTFLRASRADEAWMAVNFRGRIPGVGEAHAGNYESMIRYRPADYASPALIRQSVGVLRRASQPPTALPSSLGHLGCNHYALVTNWATFAKELHVPIYHELAPERMRTCIIFR